MNGKTNSPTLLFQVFLEVLPLVIPANIFHISTTCYVDNELLRTCILMIHFDQSYLSL